MQKQLTDAVRVLAGSRPELEMVAAGNGPLIVGGVEGVAARALARIADAERLIRDAQRSGREAANTIAGALRKAGCSPDPVAQTLAGYPVPADGARVNGQPVWAGPLFGLLTTEAAVQMADAHACGLGETKR